MSLPRLEWPEAAILLFFSGSLPLALLVDTKDPASIPVGLIVGGAIGLFFASLWHVTRSTRRRQDEKARAEFLTDANAFLRKGIAQAVLLAAAIFAQVVIVGIVYANVPRFVILGAIAVGGGIAIGLLGLVVWTKRIPHE